MHARMTCFRGDITLGPILMLQIMMEVLSGIEKLREHCKGDRPTSSVE